MELSVKKKKFKKRGVAKSPLKKGIVGVTRNCGKFFRSILGFLCFQMTLMRLLAKFLSLDIVTISMLVSSLGTIPQKNSQPHITVSMHGRWEIFGGIL